MLFQSPQTQKFHHNAHDKTDCDIHRGTPLAHFTICPSHAKQWNDFPPITITKPAWFALAPRNNPFIRPDHNLHRFNYSWNHNHNTAQWQGYIFKPIFICNNASTPSVKASADRWKRHQAETGHSLLKGPADLLMLTHLKVTSFFCAFSLHNSIYVCMFVSMNHCYWNTPKFSCVNISLSVCRDCIASALSN